MLRRFKRLCLYTLEYCALAIAAIGMFALFIIWPLGSNAVVLNLICIILALMISETVNNYIERTNDGNQGS